MLGLVLILEKKIKKHNEICDNLIDSELNKGHVLYKDYQKSKVEINLLLDLVKNS